MGVLYGRKAAAEYLGKDVKDIDRLEIEGKLKWNPHFVRPCYSINQLHNVANPEGQKTLKELQLEKRIIQLEQEKQALMDALVRR